MICLEKPVAQKKSLLTQESQTKYKRQLIAR